MSTRFILYCTLLFVVILLGTVLSTGAAPTALLETMYFGDPGIRIDEAQCRAAGIDPALEAVLIVALAGGGTEAVYRSADGSSFVMDAQPGSEIVDPRWMNWPGVEGTWFRVAVSEQGQLLAFRSDRSTFEEQIELTGELPDGAVSHACALINASGDMILLIAVETGPTATVLAVSLVLEDPDRLALESSNDTGVTVDMGSSFGAVVLSDGRIRLYTSVAGKIMSAISDNGGTKFAPEPGVRVAPGDFTSLSVQALSDPRCVHLADGRYRLYMTARISPSDGTGSQAIVSATTPTAVW